MGSGGPGGDAGGACPLRVSCLIRRVSVRDTKRASLACLLARVLHELFMYWYPRS